MGNNMEIEYIGVTLQRVKFQVCAEVDFTCTEILCCFCRISKEGV